MSRASATMDRPEGTVLLVDDTAATRQLVGYWLRSAGYAVVEAKDGREALELTGTARPDLVVLDVRLPDIHGFEVCRRIRANPLTAGLPVVHTSALEVEANRRAAGIEAGANAYLTHPFELPDLLNTVRTLLRMALLTHRDRRYEAI